MISPRPVMSINTNTLADTRRYAMFLSFINCSNIAF
jgi:hypothetical protein